MTFASLAVRSLARNRLRSGLTILGVAVAVIAFVLLRTVITSWYATIEYAARDRLGTRHKVSFILQLPKRYVEQIRQQKGVAAATWANWFGGKDPRFPDHFFATFAVDPKSYLDVYDEMVLTPQAKERWLGDRQGAIVGLVLARKLGVKEGDRISMQSQIFRGTWTFNVAGIYTSKRPSVDESQFLFQWAYFDQSMPAAMRDQVGWIVSRVDDPTRSAEISTSIDKLFESQDVQTLSMSEKALNNSFLAGFSAILNAVDIVSIIILLILMLILGNTIAMGVRERRSEYGVLRALGFRPQHVAGFVVGESLALGLFAGVLGVGIAYPLVEYGLGRWVEENMGGMFVWFRVEPGVAVAAACLAVLLGAMAGAIPAWLAARLTVVDALRRID